VAKQKTIVWTWCSEPYFIELAKVSQKNISYGEHLYL